MPLPFSRRATQTAPSFSRDFAGLKTLDHGVGPAITFTRASNATYFDASGTLQTASDNTPRFDHDPATGASRGLLIEEARTNLLTRSAEMDNAAWAKESVTVTANQGAAPDQATAADLIYPTSGSGTGRAVSQDATVTAATTYTWSAFVKSLNKGFAYLQLNQTPTAPTKAYFVTVDLSNGSVGSLQNLVSTSTGVTTTATSVGNGWYRIATTFSTDSGVTAVRCFVGVSDSANSRDVTASGTSGILAWGAQLEAGAFATSYIPTTTAAATRAADSAVVTPISSFYNQSEGTLFAEVRENGFGALYGIASLDTDTSDNRIDLRRSNDVSNVSVFVTTGGVGQATLFRSLPIAAQTYRLIGAYATNDIVAVLNGGAGAADTSATLPTLTHLKIGSLAAGSPATGVAFRLNGHIRRIAYWPRRLSNSLLQQLTT